jgi:hypothetical protein
LMGRAINIRTYFHNIQYALIRSNYNKTSICNTHNTTIYNDFKSSVLLQMCHRKRIWRSFYKCKWHSHYYNIM